MRTIIAALFLLTASAAHGDRTYLYVVDVGPNRQPPYQVLRYDENGENAEVFIDEQLNRPRDIVFLEDQGVFAITNLISPTNIRFDAAGETS